MGVLPLVARPVLDRFKRDVQTHVMMGLLLLGEHLAVDQINLKARTHATVGLQAFREYLVAGMLPPVDHLAADTRLP